MALAVFFQHQLLVPGGIFANLPPEVKNRLVMPHPLKLTCYEKWTAPIGDVWSRDHYKCLEGDNLQTYTDSPGGMVIKHNLLLALKIGFNTTFLVSVQKTQGWLEGVLSGTLEYLEDVWRIFVSLSKKWSNICQWPAGDLRVCGQGTGQCLLQKSLDPLPVTGILSDYSTDVWEIYGKICQMPLHWWKL